MVAGRTCTIPCNCEEIPECKRQTINHGIVPGTSRPARHQPRRKAWPLLIRSMQASLIDIQHTKYSMAISSHSLLGTFRRVTLVRLKHLCPAFFWLQGCGKSQLAFVIPCLMDSILGYGPSGLLSFLTSMCVYIIPIEAILEWDLDVSNSSPFSFFLPFFPFYLVGF